MRTAAARHLAAPNRPIWEPGGDPSPWAYAPRQRLTKAMRAAQLRVRWDHVQALLNRGVPMREIVRPGGVMTFGVVTIQGREMIVTEDARLRAYLCGPGLFQMPGQN